MQTGQILFPFIINGRYWRHVQVHPRFIEVGHIVIPVCSPPEHVQPGPPAYPSTLVGMKAVTFALANLAQQCGQYRVQDLGPCFWAMDNEVFIDPETGNLWLRE